MNPFYTQTKLSAPTIDYKSIWPHSATDSSDIRPTWRHYTKLTGLWSDNTEQQLLRCGLKPWAVRIFRWAPIQIHNWHVDGNPENPDKFALNWVIEGFGSVQWNSKFEFTGDLGENGYLYNESTVSDNYEAETRGHGCLVNLAIPHRVLNLEPLHRITVSILFAKHISYEMAVTRLGALGLTI